MNKDIRLIITLALIAALATGLLAVINDVTAPIIEEGAKQRLVEALGRIIDADHFEEITIEEQELTYHEAYKDGDLAGYVLRVEAKGYGSQPIVMLVGLDTDVKITGLEILSHSETPGLGDRPFTQDRLETFVGQGLEDGIDFDIVSGATSSSLGLVAGVNEAVTTLGRILGLITEIDFAIVPDGTYQGTGRGYGGEIDVEITITKGEITQIRVLNHSETLGISDPAFESIPDRIIEEQSLEVDVVSGATATSNAIKQAIRNALAEFFGGEPEEEPEEELEPVVLSEIQDGTYEGTGKGFFDAPVCVSVTVENGVIISIEFTDLTSQTADYAEIAADAMEEQLVGSSNLDVDVETGATGTAKGILEAVKNALTQGIQ